MTQLTSEHPISRTKRKIPLRLVLVVPFVLQIFAAVGLTGWLSLRNGQKEVNDIATQLRNEVTSRILQHITTYIETPQTVAQINADAVRLGELNLQNSGSLERHFWYQMQLFKSLRPIAFGNEQGEIRSVDRLDDGSLVIRVVDKSTGGSYHTYATDNQGNRTKLIKVKKTFDPRTRPWYKAAVKAGKLTWSKIYPYFSSSSLAISAARPFYDDRTGTLLGVTNATLSLFEVSDFLQNLKIGRSGQTFIMERSGDLVACSSLQQPLILNKDGAKEKWRRLQAIESNNRLTHLTAQYLIKHFGDLHRINGSQQLDFKIGSKRQFVQVTPFADAHGLDWLVVVVVPEDDFMQQINANTRTTILLCLGALVLATVIGILTSRWITRPILRLSKASSALAKQAATSDFISSPLDQKVEVQGINELELLAQSFNQMAQQLQESFAALEKTNTELEMRVEKRTAELREAKVAADTANHAKSEFLANMSHELRTPLNGILGYAQILERDKDITSKQKDAIQIIQQCGSHLLTLINDILDLSKIEARRMELYPRDFHLPSFLQEVAEICRIRAEQKEITFNYQPLNQLPTAVYADDKRLRQVLINLLGNAIKFTDKGEVNFKVCILERGENLFQSDSIIQNFKIRFQIEDTGVGMTPEQLEKIFLPFEQVGDRARRAEGTGLGLAITQKIVQMMGGKLQVKSTLGAGSSFWLDLEMPKALQEVKPVPIDLSKNIIGFKGREQKILVVDDRQENRSFLINLLEPIGFKLMHASNGEEGLDKAKAFQPDLIITDVLMPVMDGFEMTRHLRKLPKFKDTIVIASSANVSNCKQQTSLEAGCNDFIPKPIQAEGLLKKIQSYLDLEWVYPANKRTELQNHEFLNSSSSHAQTLEPVVKPPEELVALLSAARIGDIEGIEQEAIRLRKLDNKYTSFSAKILQLAQEFEEKEILKLVKLYILHH
ncbi:MAG: response regulator [Symplocastrum torsivum CPER-KK1]|jgi:signal transduction histidine kinase/FixJ family two-component response regulator|uniref:Circadian input-output histidine kinase CikA n=1 Tax=Symplocastrum torsivum CPER-KK1 TaxID=450513 RepID=A0A951PHE9_9CYAN|nr:response regulator [Symplocastrum torsivum CPER-KK1]